MNIDIEGLKRVLDKNPELWELFEVTIHEYFGLFITVRSKKSNKLYNLVFRPDRLEIQNRQVSLQQVTSYLEGWFTDVEEEIARHGHTSYHVVRSNETVLFSLREERFVSYAD